MSKPLYMQVADLQEALNRQVTHNGYVKEELARARALLDDVWRSYKLLDADQAHLDDSMEGVEAFLFGVTEGRQ